MTKIIETTFRIKTPDDKAIYGLKSTTSGKKLSAIVMVHGLNGHCQNYAFKRAADHFAEHYDVYRFDLYGGQEDARDMVDCTIAIHADDFKTVVEHIKNDYEQILAIGHSYGGSTIVMANHGAVTAACLWDPTFDVKGVREAFGEYYEPLDDSRIIVNYGRAYVMGKAMYDEALTLDAAACHSLSRALTAPVHVITAGDGFFKDAAESWHSHAPKGSTRSIIAGSVHCFVEGDTCDQLLKITGDWFGSFA